MKQLFTFALFSLTGFAVGSTLWFLYYVLQDAGQEVVTATERQSPEKRLHDITLGCQRDACIVQTHGNTVMSQIYGEQVVIPFDKSATNLRVLASMCGTQLCTLESRHDMMTFKDPITGRELVTLVLDEKRGDYSTHLAALIGE